MAKVSVIGRGLIGSAAARHLAKAGHAVTLIGPSEPADKASHQGVFASHYDEGRITRQLDGDPYWAQISMASIARYADIKAESGVSFFSEVGALMVGPKGGDFMRAVADVNTKLGIGATFAAFPYFDFGPDMDALYEQNNAGYISPRKLVLAQTNAAKAYGATVIDHAVKTLDEVAEADHVIIAAGAFTNMLLERTLDLKLFARTVALFEISEDQAARLGRMPSVVPDTADGRGPYLLPPIRYPDGKLYLKLGGDLIDHLLERTDDLGNWFRSGGASDVADDLDALMRQFMPNLEILNVKMDACVTTYTAHGKPYIGKISPRILVATGGNGAGAKCSDELGRLATVSLFGVDDPQTKPIWKD